MCKTSKNTQKQFSVRKSFLSLKRNLESVNLTIEKNYTIQRLEKCFPSNFCTKTVFWEVFYWKIFLWICVCFTVKRALWTYVTLQQTFCAAFLWLSLGTRLMWTYFVRKVLQLGLIRVDIWRDRCDRRSRNFFWAA